MIKSETKTTKSGTPEKINKSYKKLAIAVGLSISILALAIGAWQVPRMQTVADQKVVPPKEKSAEDVIAERVPRMPARAPGESPSAGIITKDSMLPGSGVEIKASTVPPQVKPTRAPLGVPTAAMLATVAPKKSMQALAVDAEGYATLPDGQRVKVNQKASPAVVALSQTPGPEGQGNKSNQDDDILKRKNPAHDAQGILLLPNGERKTMDTSGFPVDTMGMMTLPNGEKVKAGDKVYMRLKMPEPKLDARGFILMPNGEKKLADTSKFPVDAMGMMTLPNGERVNAGEKIYLMKKAPPKTDKKGFILLPSGERKLADTTGFPVDADGVMTLPNGKKIKPGEKVYLRMNKPPESPKAPTASEKAP